MHSNTPLPNWQTELANSFTDPLELLAHLNLKIEAPDALQDAARSFPFRVTKAYAGRIRKNDINDPLLRQVLPVADELHEQAGFTSDPVGDLDRVATPGLLHKYQGRILMIATGACAIHCRYCFRREFPYDVNQVSKRRIQEALTHIASDTSINEVILSGGDPLTLSDDRLLDLIQSIESIPHIDRLRIHSRLPVVLPNRITPQFNRMLADTRLRCVLVIHANHPNELDESVETALRSLILVGVSLLNQTVLLKGVNDRTDCLKQLSERLFDCGVLPYYLHLLDRARGTAHFEVEQSHALALHESLRRELPGYLVPKMVRELSGEPYKTPIA